MYYAAPYRIAREQTGLPMIRYARVRDAAAVHAVLLTAKDDIPLAANFADQAHQNWVRDECKNRRVWIDERAGEVSGVLVMRVAEMFYLVTAPSFRNRVVGDGLIDHAIEMVKHRYSCGVTARVREENRQIVSLLRKKRFYVHPVLVASQPGWVVYALGNVD